MFISVPPPFSSPSLPLSAPFPSPFLPLCSLLFHLSVSLAPFVSCVYASVALSVPRCVSACHLSSQRLSGGAFALVSPALRCRLSLPALYFRPFVSAGLASPKSRLVRLVKCALATRLMCGLVVCVYLHTHTQMRMYVHVRP